jgi:ABC-type transporter Mla MlaB component
MLRITINDEKDAVILSLEGELIGPWVEEVEQCWKKVFASLGDRSVHVDLSAVSFVDAAGGALLQRMHEAGFRFAGGAALRQAWDGEGFDSQAGANQQARECHGQGVQTHPDGDRARKRGRRNEV